MSDFTEVETLEAEVYKLNQEIEEYKDRIETLEGLLRRIVQYGGRTPVLKVVGFQISVDLLEEAQRVIGDPQPEPEAQDLPTRHRNFHPEICRMLDQFDGLMNSAQLRANDLQEDELARAVAQSAADAYGFMKQMLMLLDRKL